jgi:hypothetical protein
MRRLRLVSISLLLFIYATSIVFAFYPTYHEITASKQLADHFSSTEAPRIQTSRLEVKDEVPQPISLASQTMNDFEMTSGTVNEEVKNNHRRSNHSEIRHRNRPKHRHVSSESNRKSATKHEDPKNYKEKNHKQENDSSKEALNEKSTKEEVNLPVEIEHQYIDQDQEMKMIPMHLLQHNDPSVLLSRKRQYEQIQLYPESDYGQYSALQAEHKHHDAPPMIPRYYDYDYDVAYRSDFYWLIPLVIIIGIGALILPLCSLFMTTMVSNGAINLTGRRKRSLGDPESNESLSYQILTLVTKVEEALITLSKHYSIADKRPEL